MTRTDTFPQPVTGTARQCQATLAGPNSEQRGPADAEKRIFILSPQFTSQIGHSSSRGGSCEWKHEARQMQAASLIPLFFFFKAKYKSHPDLKPSHPKYRLSHYPFPGIPIAPDACATLLSQHLQQYLLYILMSSLSR